MRKDKKKINMSSISDIFLLFIVGYRWEKQRSPLPSAKLALGRE